jgi:hypothetical protein
MEEYGARLNELVLIIIEFYCGPNAGNASRRCWAEIRWFQAVLFSDRPRSWKKKEYSTLTSGVQAVGHRQPM